MQGRRSPRPPTAATPQPAPRRPPPAEPPVRRREPARATRCAPRAGRTPMKHTHAASSRSSSRPAGAVGVDVHRRPAPERHRVPAGRGRRDVTEAGPVLQVAAAPERAPLRHAHPHLDTEEPERFLTSEKKNVLVDSFVKWRIIDVRQYYVSVRRRRGPRAKTRLRRRSNDACARSSASARCTRWSRRARQDHGSDAREGRRRRPQYRRARCWTCG